MKVLWLVLLIGLYGVHCTKDDDEDLGEFAEFDVADETFPSSTIESILERTPLNSDSADAKVKPAEDQKSQSDAYEEFEDDDFEGIETSTKSESDSGEKVDKPGKSEKKPEITHLTMLDIPSHFRSNWYSYQVEALTLCIILLYVFSYIYGKTRNYAIASDWLAQNRSLLEQQFALVGDDGVSQEPTGGHLIRETDSNFSVWCSGRVGCQGMLSQLRLKKRQDLFSHVLNIFRPRKDRVIHRIELDRGEMDSFVFILGQRKTVIGSVKELTDLQTFTKERRNINNLPSSFTIFAEIAESIPALIDLNVLNFIRKHEDYIDYIHFSDQYSGPRPQDDGSVPVQLPDVKPVLHFSFYIVPDEADANAEVYKNLMQFTFFMVDRVRNYRLSREGKNKADRTRKSVEEAFLKTTHQQRQEAAQARREEKARERKQRVMEEEDPEKQRRLEKLEQKREAKLRQPRMKQVRVK